MENQNQDFEKELNEFWGFKIPNCVKPIFILLYIFDDFISILSKNIFGIIFYILCLITYVLNKGMTKLGLFCIKYSKSIFLLFIISYILWNIITQK